MRRPTRIRQQAPGRTGLLFLALASLGACGRGPLDVVGMPAHDVGLVAYWSFDEGMGAVLPDHSGNALDGTLTGGTWIADGRFGGALSLVSGDYVTVPNFPAATPDWTVSAWVRYAPADIGADLSTIVTTEIPRTGGWELQGPVNAEAAKLQFSYVRPSGPYNTLICCQIAPDQWMHVTAVVDSRALTATLYLGGLVQTFEAVPTTIAPGNTNLHIGIEQVADRLIWPFRGAVDEIRIYGRALNAAEVMRLDAAP